MTATNTAAATTNTMSNEDLMAMVAGSRYSHHLNLDEALASEKQNQIIMGYDGLFIRRKEEFNGNTITIVTKTDKAPGLKNPPESIKCTVTNKIPGKLFKEMVSWFRAVYELHKTESAAQIYRNKETGEYFVYYPKQKVYRANVDYKDDLDAAVNLRQKHILVLEAHSHPWGSGGGKPWFSGGDDANEKFACFYLVVGSVMADAVGYGARMKLQDLQQPMQLEEMFDFTGIEEPLSTKDLPKVNKKLFEKLKTNTYTHTTGTTTYTGTGSYKPLNEAELAEIRKRNYEAIYGKGTYTGRGHVYGLPVPGSYRDDTFRSEAYGEAFRHRSLANGYTAPRSALGTLNSSTQIDFEWLISKMSMEECIALTEMLADKLEARKK